MDAYNPAAFTMLVALVGLVILVASLASGAIERSGFPPLALFLGIGALLGPFALDLISFELTSPTLGAIATLSLVLVLFTDSVSLDPPGLRRHLRLAALVLGPGTALCTALIAFAAWWLLDLHPAAAAILGAALASTDPVMMRGLLRLPNVPAATRYALGIESGLNDAVVLPVVLVGMIFLGTRGDAGLGEVARVGLDVFLLGPAIGAGVGFLAVRLLERLRRRYGMRRDYESLYVLGIAFTAFAGAEAVHGSGFMAAFAAGLAVAALDVELCDCFHEYGEATAEMLLLLSFVALGASLIWTGLAVLTPRTLAFAGAALLCRSVVLHLALPRSGGGLDAAARRLIVWYGPRALSSLLLVLVPVFAGVGEAAALFPVAALVVLLSIALHGSMLMVLTPRYRRVAAADPGGELVRFEDLARMEEAGVPLRILDVRKQRDYDRSPTRAKGSVRVDPDRPVESAASLALPRHGWLVAYCA